MSHGPLIDAEYEDALRHGDAPRVRQQYHDDLRLLLSNDWGRRIATRLVFRVCGLRARSYDPGQKYEVKAAMAYREGQRAVGEALMRDIDEASPELHDQLNNEWASYTRRIRTELKQAEAAFMARQRKGDE